ESFFASEKEQMADKAVDIIKDHSVIMLDSSTTCLKLAEAIISSGKCITLITNSLRISSLFNSQSSNVNLICLG
ncbi:DeoR/GlpR transcriptional regulator, partial [[Clostridium] scindens]|nr:DeoR/GlpR transcriptional regulator [[Clostridium] scindens]